MLTTLRILLVATLVIFAQGHAAGLFLARGSIELSVKIIVNAVEGSPRSECEASEEVRASSKKEWWVAVAETMPHPQGGWEAVGSGIRCGRDSFEKAQLDSQDPSVNPYLIAGGSTLVRLLRQMEDERVLEVEVSLSLQKLSGFEKDGQPVYEQSQVKRNFSFAESGP